MVIDPFLAADDVVQADHPAVRAAAARLRGRHPDDVGFSRAAYEFVRDEVRHSFDADDPRVTVTAAEVLEHRVGLCYAKSHLLAALLRAEGVPAGLCYQRLATGDGGFVLHGLVAVHLDGRWHRQDPRGNRPGVDAQFSLDGPRLAFTVDPSAGERDYEPVYAAADPGVLAALRARTDVLTLRTAGLPGEPLGPDHRAVEQALLRQGWRPCGAGDWAIALRSPDGTAAARISPFDPTGPYTAALYREAAHTRQVPALYAHRRLAGGGDLQVLEWLEPVPHAAAAAFHRAIAERSPEVAELVDVVRSVHERARRDLPWCGPLDDNPANVMRGADGRLVVVDLFYADGPDLYAAAATDPDRVAALIPEAERRFMTEIPLAGSGPWDPAEREAMRAGLAAADARRAAEAGP
ncbi:transglutaminase family protein [Dactylosporangium sucinum]|uniref:Transglutaminase-like domain-containing protein n=1 Tax=Dactylosporangium sucinum TaxID=1424081 RepID=A0A917TZS4_9ACTN|nr:transglutaminase family protein [Dactylosporangium sucinum]GGM46670.1 hypothetical protein GCM10007977_055450 [Dactylosporangium sucinum]